MNISHILKQNIAGKLFNHGIVFLINVVIVRSLDINQSGHYFNELYLINFFAFMFSAGMDYSAIAWISREPAAAAVIHKRLTEAVLFFIAIAMVFTLIILPETKMVWIQSALAIILFSSGNLMLILFQGVLSAMKKFNLQNWILITSNLCFLSYLFFLKKGEDNIQSIALGYSFLYFLQGIIMAVFSYQKITNPPPKISWISFYRNGFMIMISSLIYFCFLRTDNFFVEKYCSGTTLSNYVQCGKVGQYFIYFSSVISSTLLPFLSAENAVSSYREWRKLVTPYYFLIISGAMFLMLFGFMIYPFVFGKAFSEMNEYMVILLPGYVCLGLLTLINAAYLSKGNVNKIFKGDLLGFAIVLLADFILVPKFGVKAAAIISSVGYVIVFLYLWRDVKNQFNIN